MAWFNASPPRLTGVDISTSAVKVLELSLSGGQYRVEAYGVAAVPKGAISDRELKDVAAVTEAIQTAISRSGTTNNNAAIAMRSSAVITKVVQLQADLSPDDMEAQVKIELSRDIPYSIDEVNVDFEVLGPASVGKNSNQEHVDVLIAACRREQMETLVDMVEDAGLHVKVVDVEPYAMERACKLLTADLPSHGKNKTILLIDIGAEMTTLTVLHNLQTVYMREEEFGGKQLTAAIQTRYGLSYEEAGKAKKMGNFKESYEQEILAPFRNALIPLIRRSMQFFYSATPYQHIDHIILAGGTANIAGLTSTVHNQFESSVAIANPFAKMTLASSVNEKMLMADASALMVPAGLALRSFE